MVSHLVTRRAAVARTTLAVVAALAVGGVGGCGTEDPPSNTQPSATASTSAATSGVTVRDPWAKAADTGMTAVFGTLVNNGPADITITGATSPLSPIELHEMAMESGKMVMRQKTGGLTIKAKSSHPLEPGGDHLMLMKLAKPVQAGDEVTITLTLADGGSIPFTAVAKPFAGAQESYAPGTHESHPA
ncbi:copper chaperone PCu(A)C [Micromonospora sp. NPDC003197]